MKIPTLTQHHGRARVRIGARDIYLGEHNSAESQSRYHLICLAISEGRCPFEVAAEWNPNYAQAAEQTQQIVAAVSVTELATRWVEATASYYASPTGRSEGKTHTCRRIAEEFHNSFPGVNVDEFKPRDLVNWQTSLADRGYTRTYIRGLVNFARACFQWGVIEELVKPDVWHALLAVKHLRPHKSAAAEPRVVQSVSIERVNATLPFLEPVYQRLVTFQILTGCRPGEAIFARWDEIDTIGIEGVWVYRPQSHKTQSKGKDRTIPIGPKCQAMLAKCGSQSGYLFGDDEPPCRVDSYRHAVGKACERAFDCPAELRHHRKRTPLERSKASDWRAENAWFPYQLRHLAGTEIAKAADLEHVAAVLGHSSTNTSRIYVDNDETLIKAVQVAKELG